jgi:hypothetical protein
MYCVPPRNNVFVICSNHEDVVDYWNYLQKYRDVFKPFATYAKIAEYVMGDSQVVTPEPPITLSQYGKEEYFFDAIAVKIAYDLTWKGEPVDYYYAPGKFENKIFDGAIHIRVNNMEIPAPFIPSTTQALVDSLKNGVLTTNLMGVKMERVTTQI